MERITTKFGFSSTAAEVIEGVDLGGKRAIVTGGASGIGLETAKALSVAGAAVTLAVRRPEAARAVAEDIRVATCNNSVEVRSLDISDLASVRRFCADWTGPLQIPINNAGIMALQDLQRTPGGWEMQFATNFSRSFCFDDGASFSLGGSIRRAYRVRFVER
jgi:NAD(P)-dependent dehydrogenase (short-subunit alcohol dehydrogenase family)